MSVHSPRAARILVLSLATVLVACAANKVTINYHQVGACNGYAGPNGAVSAGPNAAYVIFAIESIDNTQTKTNFNYNPASMCITQQNRCIDPNLQLVHDVLGPFATVPVTVNAGQQMGFSPNGFGALVVQTVNANGAVEANQTNYFLNQYQNQPANTSVLLVKSNSSQTSWPLTEDSKQIQLK